MNRTKQGPQHINCKTLDFLVQVARVLVPVITKRPQRNMSLLFCSGKERKIVEEGKNITVAAHNTVHTSQKNSAHCWNAITQRRFRRCNITLGPAHGMENGKVSPVIFHCDVRCFFLKEDCCTVLLPPQKRLSYKQNVLWCLLLFSQNEGKDCIILDLSVSRDRPQEHLANEDTALWTCPALVHSVAWC
jgi:hypothetical protein